MQLIDQDVATEELSKISPVDQIQAGAFRNNYTALNPADFEMLLYEIYDKNAPVDDWYDRATLMITGADQGRDIWLTKSELPVGLIQCKKIKSSFTLPDTMREIIKFLLHTRINSKFRIESSLFHYILAVSVDPTGATVDFFQSPQKHLTENSDNILEYINDLIRKYTQFRSINAGEILPQIQQDLRRLTYKLIRPMNLDACLENLPDVRRRFFQERVVIGLEEATAAIREELASARGLQPAVDTEVLDKAIVEEIRRLKRQRLILPSDHLIRYAISFSERLEHGLQLATAAVRGAAYREVATIFAREKRVEDAEQAIKKATALGADTTAELARLAMARQDLNDALQRLRTRDDPEAKSLIFSAIQMRDGDAAALKFFDEHLVAGDLTGYGLYAVANRMIVTKRIAEAGRLLASATPDQIDENPLVLYMRARLEISNTLPADLAGSFIVSDGLIPHPSNVREDSEGQRRLDAARVDFQTLKDTLVDLSAPDLERLVNTNIIFLNLHARTEEDREAARRLLSDRLSRRNPNLELVGIGVLYAPNTDWTYVYQLLDQAKALGGYNDTELLANFTLLIHNGTPYDMIHLIEKYREKLSRYLGYCEILSIEVQAFLKIGQVENAKEIISKSQDKIDHDNYIRLNSLICEATGGNPLELRLAQFERSENTSDLEILVHALAEAGDDRLGEYSERLWDRRHLLSDAKNTCYAYFRTGEYQKAEAFLDRIKNVVDHDEELQTYLASIHHRQGRLLEAANVLEKLRREGIESANIRQLGIILAIETGRWVELEPLFQKDLREQNHRTAEQLISAARLAQTLDSASTMPLVRAAIAKNSDDANLCAAGYIIATERGEEQTNEVRQWFEKAIKHSDSNGPFFPVSFEHTVDMILNDKADATQINKMVKDAEMPLSVAFAANGRSQSALILINMQENIDELDSRRKTILPLFAGNRFPEVGFDPISIALEPIAILILHTLGLLDFVIDSFNDVVLPANTLNGFFVDLGRCKRAQPSQIAEARRIRDLVTRGILTTASLPMPAEDFLQRVDDEFTQLFNAAELHDGYVLHTSPLHPPGTLNETVDHAPFAHRLTSPAGALASLKRTGALTMAAASRATIAIANSGTAWDNEQFLERGKPIFISSLALHYLSEAEILPQLKVYAGSLLVRSEVKIAADREIAGEEASLRVRQGIERIRETLATAITNGRVRVGPSWIQRDVPGRSKSELREETEITPIMYILQQSGRVDALLCDDRSLNKYEEFTDSTGHKVKFLTTPQLLVLLSRKGRLSDTDLAAARERLRLGGASLMPIYSDEIFAAVKASDWTSGPNADLKALRDSIHLPLAHRLIKLPEERVWLQCVTTALVFSIRRAWQEIEDDVIAERASDYLLDILPDLHLWTTDETTPDRDIWVQQTFRSNLWWISMIPNLEQARNEQFKRWFDERVLPMTERQDPGAIKAVAKTLFASLTSPENEE